MSLAQDEEELIDYVEEEELANGDEKGGDQKDTKK
jgi:hypothetical protein